MNDCWPTMQTRLHGRVHLSPRARRSSASRCRWASRPIARPLGQGPADLAGRGARLPQPQQHARRPGEDHLGRRAEGTGSSRPCQASDATFRVLISPTPLVGPDRAEQERQPRQRRLHRTKATSCAQFLAAQKNMRGHLRRPPLAVRLGRSEDRASASTPAARPATSTPAAGARATTCPSTTAT